MELLGALGVFVVSFLLGSIPWGVIISKVFYHTDIREHGSGNIGTTNAMRTMGKVGGSAVFVLDFGKGIVSGLIAAAAAAMFGGGMSLSGHVIGYDDFVTVAFLGCVWGHIFSPWLKFKGGKGIAVAATCLWFVFGPVGFFIEIAAFALGIAITRCVSVGSIAAAAICPLLALYFYWGQWVPWLIIAATACVVIWAHRANIARLRAGTENKIGGKKCA